MMMNRIMMKLYAAGADLQSVPLVRTVYKPARTGAGARAWKYSLHAAIWLLCGTIFLLASCNREDLQGSNNRDDDKASMNHLDGMKITVSTLAFGEGGDLMLRSSEGGDLPNGKLGSKAGFPVKNRKPVRIADDLLMVAALQEDDAPVTLRNVALMPGTRLYIVAYTGSGYTTYVDHAEYEESPLGFLIPIGAGLTIPTGPCKFVAYSYNSTAPMPPHNPAMTVDMTNDLLWGETIQTVIESAFNLHITMQHLFSQVRLDASLDSGAPVYINTFNIGQAELHSYQQPVLSVQSGALTPGTAGSVSFTNAGPYNLFNWISAPRLTYTNSETPTFLELANLNINGIVYSGPFRINYADPLVPGKSYTLKVVFHRASGGSADRITFEGSGNSAKLVITHNANDPGLLFKFGSVVGMNHLQGTFNVSTMIEFNPLANPSLITEFGNTTPYLPGVPAYSNENLTIHNFMNISLDIYHNLDSIKIGKGDPCRLIGMTADEIRNFSTNTQLYAREEALATTLGPDGYPIGGWRLPTALENERFMGGYEYSSGTAFWWNSSGSPFGIPPVAGGEFPAKNSNGGQPDLSKFLPESGRREEMAGLYSPNMAFYSSSTPWPVLHSFNGIDYYALGQIFTFSNTHAYSSTSTNAFSAFAIRCVRQDPFWSMFSASQNEWVPSTLGGGTSGEGDLIFW